MKFNIDVELDYIDEEGCLDEAIKESILSSVTNIVMEKVSKQVDDKLDEIVIKAAEEKANSIIDSINEDFMNRKFNKIDRYGDVIEADVTVKDMLKTQFDSFWNGLVNENGRSNNSYEPQKPRIKWLIDERIREHSEKFSKILTDDTEKKIKATLKENLSKTIGAKLMKDLGFDKLLLESK